MKRPGAVDSRVVTGSFASLKLERFQRVGYNRPGGQTDVHQIVVYGVSPSNCTDRFVALVLTTCLG